MIVPPDPPHIRIYADDAAEFAILMDCARQRYLALHGLRPSAQMEQHIADARNLARATRQSLVADLADASVADDLASMMSVMEYANRRKVTRQAVTERCRRGTLPARKINGAWFIYQSEEDSA